MIVDEHPDSAQRTERTSFFGDVLRLASGTGLAQIIGVAAAPFLTRLYAPEHYGAAAVFVSITAIISVVACLRYEYSIVLPARDREAANLMVLSIVASLLIASIAALLIWALRDSTAWAGETGIAKFLWLIPVAVFLHGIHQSLSFWNSRKRQYTRQSVAAVTGASVTVSTQFAAAFAGLASGGAMIAAKLGGQLMATGALTVQLLTDSGRFFRRQVRWRRMIRGLARHRKFPIFGTFAAVLNALSWQLPVLMLGLFFSPAAAGYYALGFQLLQVPMALIGGSISRVFLERAASAKNDGTLTSLVEALFDGLTVVCLFPMLVLAVIGQDLFDLVFGSRWIEAGVYAQILSIWAFVWFVSSPMSTLFGVFEKQEQGLLIQTIIFLSRLVSLGVGAYIGDARVALGLFSITGVLAYGYLATRIFKLAGVDLREPAATMLNQLAISAPLLVPVGLAAAFDVAAVYVVVLAAIVCAVYLSIQRERAAALINLRVTTNE